MAGWPGGGGVAGRSGGRQAEVSDPAVECPPGSDRGERVTPSSAWPSKLAQRLATAQAGFSAHGRRTGPAGEFWPAAPRSRRAGRSGARSARRGGKLASAFMVESDPYDAVSRACEIDLTTPVSGRAVPELC